MPLSYDFIEKPPQVQIIDQFFSGSPDDLRSAYEYALERLGGSDTLDTTTDVVRNERPGPLQGLTDDDVAHFKNHWLNPAANRLHPWSGADVEDVMRRAYLDAVNAANSRAEPVPIETFWVFTSAEQFEMRVSESEKQITVFALIPKTPEIEFNEPTRGDQIRVHRPERGRD